MNIKYLYENTDLTQKEIATRLGSTPKVVGTYIRKHYSSVSRKARHKRNVAKSKVGALNPMHGLVGDMHHRYIGTTPDGKGYMLVLKPLWYTGRKGSKHIFEHHAVVAEALGLTAIPKGWCVHHCDQVKMNNSFDNLVLLTLSDHSRLHQSVLDNATTISKESTLKWVETHGTPFKA